MTVYNFTPNINAPYQFQPTLDGQVHSAIVRWNLFGQRFYLEIYDLNGTRVITRAMVGSPLDYDISLTGGIFSSKVVYRVQNNQIEVTP